MKRKVYERVWSLVLSLCFLFQNILYGFVGGPSGVNSSALSERCVIEGVLISEGGLEVVVPDSAFSPEQAKEALRDFLLYLTVPREDLWVNLSLDSELSRILPLPLRLTDVGREMLVADLRLKKDFIELYYSALGEGEYLDDGDVTFPRRLVIVPDRAVLRGSDDGVIVEEARLRVEWEGDVGRDERELIEEKIIRELNRRINRDPAYEGVRRIYRLALLADWYKRVARERELPFEEVIDTRQVGPFISKEPWSKWEIYREYLRSYLLGEDWELDAVELVAGGVSYTQLNSGLAFLHEPLEKLWRRIKRKGDVVYKVLIQPVENLAEYKQEDSYEKIITGDGKVIDRLPARIREDLSEEELVSEMLSRTWRFFYEDEERDPANVHYLRGLIESQFLRPVAFVAFKATQGKAWSEEQFIEKFKALLIEKGLLAYRLYLKKYTDLSSRDRLTTAIRFYQILSEYTNSITAYQGEAGVVNVGISLKGKVIDLKVTDKGVMSASMRTEDLSIFPAKHGESRVEESGHIFAASLRDKEHEVGHLKVKAAQKGEEELFYRVVEKLKKHEEEILPLFYELRYGGDFIPGDIKRALLEKEGENWRNRDGSLSWYKLAEEIVVMYWDLLRDRKLSGREFRGVEEKFLTTVESALGSTDLISGIELRTFGIPFRRIDAEGMGRAKWCWAKALKGLEGKLREIFGEDFDDELFQRILHREFARYYYQKKERLSQDEIVRRLKDWRRNKEIYDYLYDNVKISPEDYNRILGKVRENYLKQRAVEFEIQVVRETVTLESLDKGVKNELEEMAGELPEIEEDAPLDDPVISRLAKKPIIHALDHSLTEWLVNMASKGDLHRLSEEEILRELARLLKRNPKLSSIYSSVNEKDIVAMFRRANLNRKLDALLKPLKEISKATAKESEGKPKEGKGKKSIKDRLLSGRKKGKTKTIRREEKFTKIILLLIGTAIVLDRIFGLGLFDASAHLSLLPVGLLTVQVSNRADLEEIKRAIRDAERYLEEYLPNFVSLVASQTGDARQRVEKIIRENPLFTNKIVMFLGQLTGKGWLAMPDDPQGRREVVDLLVQISRPKTEEGMRKKVINIWKKYARERESQSVSVERSGQTESRSEKNLQNQEGSAERPENIFLYLLREHFGITPFDDDELKKVEGLVVPSRILNKAKLALTEGKSVLFTGKAGGGKSTILRKLAQDMMEGKVSFTAEDGRDGFYLPLRVSAGVLVEKIQGSPEESLEAIIGLLKSLEEMSEESKTVLKPVLFIDEIHLLTEKAKVLSSSVLLQALEDRKIVIVGATTSEEAKRYIFSNFALKRRFEEVDVEFTLPELDKAVQSYAKKLLQELGAEDVEITDDAITAAVEFGPVVYPDRTKINAATSLLETAIRNVVNRRQKMEVLSTEIRGLVNSINLLTQAYKRGNQRRIKIQANAVNERLQKLYKEWKRLKEARDVIDEKAIVDSARMLGVPELMLDENYRREYLKGLEPFLKERVQGQDEAIKAVVEILKTKMSVPEEERKGLWGSFLFLGPTGVGKTELAKAIAGFIFGDEAKIIRVDMGGMWATAIFGAPPAYVGFDRAQKTLPEQIKEMPGKMAVVLLDEIEKLRDRAILDKLLAFLDEGRLEDFKGTEVHTKNVVLIMTSNLGAELIREGMSYEEIKKAIIEKLERRSMFRPEDIGRIDKVIVFRPLDEKTVKEILRHKLKKISDMYKTRYNIDLLFRDEDKLSEKLAQYFYSPKYGFRQVDRGLMQKIVGVMNEAFEEGKISPGSTVELYLKTSPLSKDEFVAKGTDFAIQYLTNGVEEKVYEKVLSEEYIKKLFGKGDVADLFLDYLLEKFRTSQDRLIDEYVEVKGKGVQDSRDLIEFLFEKKGISKDEQSQIFEEFLSQIRQEAVRKAVEMGEEEVLELLYEGYLSTAGLELGIEVKEGMRTDIPIFASEEKIQPVSEFIRKKIEKKEEMSVGEVLSEIEKNWGRLFEIEERGLEEVGEELGTIEINDFAPSVVLGDLKDEEVVGAIKEVVSKASFGEFKDALLGVVNTIRRIGLSSISFKYNLPRYEAIEEQISSLVLPDTMKKRLERQREELLKVAKENVSAKVTVYLPKAEEERVELVIRGEVGGVLPIEEAYDFAQAIGHQIKEGVLDGKVPSKFIDIANLRQRALNEGGFDLGVEVKDGKTVVWVRMALEVRGEEEVSEVDTGMRDVGGDRDKEEAKEKGETSRADVPGKSGNGLIEQVAPALKKITHIIETSENSQEIKRRLVTELGFSLLSSIVDLWKTKRKAGERQDYEGDKSSTQSRASSRLPQNRSVSNRVSLATEDSYERLEAENNDSDASEFIPADIVEDMLKGIEEYIRYKEEIDRRGSSTIDFWEEKKLEFLLKRAIYLADAILAMEGLDKSLFEDILKLYIQILRERPSNAYPITVETPPDPLLWIPLKGRDWKSLSQEIKSNLISILRNTRDRYYQQQIASGIVSMVGVEEDLFKEALEVLLTSDAITDFSSSPKDRLLAFNAITSLSYALKGKDWSEIPEKIKKRFIGLMNRGTGKERIAGAVCILSTAEVNDPLFKKAFRVLRSNIDSFTVLPFSIAFKDRDWNALPDEVKEELISMTRVSTNEDWHGYLRESAWSAILGMVGVENRLWEEAFKVLNNPVEYFPSREYKCAVANSLKGRSWSDLPEHLQNDLKRVLIRNEKAVTMASFPAGIALGLSRVDKNLIQRAYKEFMKVDISYMCYAHSSYDIHFMLANAFKGRRVDPSFASTPERRPNRNSSAMIGRDSGEETVVEGKRHRARHDDKAIVSHPNITDGISVSEMIGTLSRFLSLSEKKTTGFIRREEDEELGRLANQTVAFAGMLMRLKRDDLNVFRKSMEALRLLMKIERTDFAAVVNLIIGFRGMNWLEQGEEETGEMLLEMMRTGTRAESVAAAGAILGMENVPEELQKEAFGVLTFDIQQNLLEVFPIVFALQGKKVRDVSPEILAELTSMLSSEDHYVKGTAASVLLGISDISEDVFTNAIQELREVIRTGGVLFVPLFGFSVSARSTERSSLPVEARSVLYQMSTKGNALEKKAAEVALLSLKNLSEGDVERFVEWLLENASGGMISIPFGIGFKGRSWGELSANLRNTLINYLRNGNIHQKEMAAVAIVNASGVNDGLFKEALEQLKEFARMPWASVWINLALACKGNRPLSDNNFAIGRQYIDQILYQGGLLEAVVDGTRYYSRFESLGIDEVVSKLGILTSVSGVKKLVGLLKSNPPRKIVVFDRILGRDIQGYGREDLGIGLYRGISENSFAWLHEVLEYLRSKKLISYELKGDRLRVVDRDGEVLLDATTEGIKDKWLKGAKRGNPHYAWRIVQRSLEKVLGGEGDSLLSGQIRLNNLFAKVERRYGVDVGKLMRGMLGLEVSGEVGPVSKEHLIGAIEELKEGLGNVERRALAYLNGGADIPDLGKVEELLREGGESVVNYDESKLRRYLEEGKVVVPIAPRAEMGIVVGDSELAERILEKIERRQDYRSAFVEAQVEVGRELPVVLGVGREDRSLSPGGIRLTGLRLVAVR